MQKSARPRTQDVDPPWKRALDQNVRYLQDNLMLTESIYAYLIEENILTMEMIDMIKSSSDTEHGRTFELVKCLKKRTENCFDKFLHILRDTGNKFVADKLEQSMIPPSRRNSSRQSISSDEMDLLLQTKDKQIQELESKLVAKDRRIKELENVADNLKLKVDEALVHLREEIRTCDRYKMSMFHEDLQNVKDMQLEINKKEEQLLDAEEKVAELQLRVVELEDELEYIREDLQTREEDLNSVLENERRIKKRLGLNENASDRELMEHLQKSFHTRAELKRAQDELADINRAKMDLDDCIKTLEHQKDGLQFEVRQKELEIRRIRRGNLDSAVPVKRRDPTITATRRQMLISERTKTLPRIDVNPYPQLHEPAALMPSISIPSARSNLPTARSNLPTARVPPAVAQQGHMPMLPRRKTFASIEDRETKYCVICRRNYYLKNECRIHVEPIVSGRFSCCGSDANGKYIGCKTVNHLYIHFTGLGNDYIFYDDRGRPLDFKDQ